MEKAKEKVSPLAAALGTIRGPPPAGLNEDTGVAAGMKDALENPFEEPIDTTLFEEPRVDEFGTGHGF